MYLFSESLCRFKNIPSKIPESQSLLGPHLAFFSKGQRIIPALGPYSSCKSGHLLLLWSSAHRRSQCPHIGILCSAPCLGSSIKSAGWEWARGDGQGYGEEGQQEDYKWTNWGPQREDDSEGRESHHTSETRQCGMQEAAKRAAAATAQAWEALHWMLCGSWRWNFNLVIISHRWISRRLWLIASC